MASSADGNATPPTSSSMDTSPKQCATGCGFFGNPNTGGMCSKCYKETLAKSSGTTPASTAAAAPIAPAPVPMPAPAPAPIVPSAVPVVESQAPPAPLPASGTPPTETTAAPAPAAAAASGEDSTDEPPKKKQVNLNRCWTCNKKIGLLGFKCKCEFTFCSEHRYSDRHACEFDYKGVGKEQLSKANPTISPAKMESI